jgi:hypothetical protein
MCLDDMRSQIWLRITGAQAMQDVHSRNKAAGLVV